MNRRTPTQITAWEEGQVLIKAQDCLFECIIDLKNTKPKWADELRAMALRIGTIFNKHGSHAFGLSGEEDKG